MCVCVCVCVCVYVCNNSPPSEVVCVCVCVCVYVCNNSPPSDMFNRGNLALRISFLFFLAFLAHEFNTSLWIYGWL